MKFTHAARARMLDAIATRKATLAAGPRTMAELCRLTGLTPSRLHKYCAGELHMPPATLAAILRELPEMRADAATQSTMEMT